MVGFRRRPSRLAGLIAVLMVAVTAIGLAPAGPAQANAGEWLDPTYSGATWTTLDGRGRMSNVDALGRVYVSNPEVNEDGTYTWLRRLTNTGAIDPTFGGGRVALVSDDDTAASIPVHRLHVDDAGRLVVVSGESHGPQAGGWDTVVRRFTSDGELDLSFGTDGLVSLEAGYGNVPYYYGFAARPGGGYFVAFGDNGSLPDNRYIAALTEAGELDTSWAPTAPIPGMRPMSPFAIFDLATDGNQLLVLGRPPTVDTLRPQLLRLTASGALDSSFATNGVLDLPGDPLAVYHDLTVRDGAYYVAGVPFETWNTDAGNHVLLVKVLGSGALDDTFGVDGLARSYPGDCPATSQTQVYVTDAYITVVTTIGCPAHRTLLRFSLDGVVDQSFGHEGSVVIDAVGGLNVLTVSATTIQPNGQIVGLALQPNQTAGPGLFMYRPFRTAYQDPAPLAGSFVPLAPARVLDTRDGTGVPAAGVVPAGGSVELTVAGQAGVPATGAGAVVLNVTATQPTATGYVTVYPTGEPLPTASNLNFRSGQTVPNLVIVKLGTNGTVTLHNGSPGTVHLIADIAGYYHAGPATEPGTYQPLTPARVLDTRDGTGVPAGAVPPGTSIDLPLAGQAGVPTTGAGAVVLNVTVTQAQARGYVTVYPAGEPLPTASNLNFPADRTVANLVTVKLGTDGTITLHNGSTDTIHLIADVAGYYRAGPATARGTFVPLTPTRILDTRNGTGTPNNESGPLLSGTTIPLRIDITAGTAQRRASAAVLNVTAATATHKGFLTLYPSHLPPPPTSNVNTNPDTTVANLATVQNGSNGTITLQHTSNQPTATAHVIVDIFGYFNR